MWHARHGTVHGPDTLDFSRTSKQDHVRAHARMCAHVRVSFGDVAVLLRNSKDQKVRKHEGEKRWEKLDLGLCADDDDEKDVVAHKRAEQKRKR